MASGRKRGRSVRLDELPTIADVPFGCGQSTKTSTVNSMAYHHLEDLPDDVRALHAQEVDTTPVEVDASSSGPRTPSALSSCIRSGAQAIRDAAVEKRSSRASSVSDHAGTSIVPGRHQIIKQTQITQVSTPIEAPSVLPHVGLSATSTRAQPKKNSQAFATIMPLGQGPGTASALVKSRSIQSIGQRLKDKSRSLLLLRQKSEDADLATAETTPQIQAHYHSRKMRPERRMLNHHKSLPALRVMAVSSVASPAARAGVTPRARGASVASAPGGIIARLDSVAEDPNELDPKYDPYGKCNSLRNRRSGDLIVRRKPVRKTSQARQTPAFAEQDGSERLFEQRANEYAAAKRSEFLAESLEERQEMLIRVASSGARPSTGPARSTGLQVDDDVQAVSARTHRSQQAPAQASASVKASRFRDMLPRTQRDLRKVQTLPDLRSQQVQPPSQWNEDSRSLCRHTTVELIGLPAVPPIPARYRKWEPPPPQPPAIQQSQSQLPVRRSITVASANDLKEDRSLFTRAPTAPPYASCGVRNACTDVSGIAWRPAQVSLYPTDGRYYIDGMGSLLSDLDEQRQADAAAKAKALIKPREGPLIRPEELSTPHKRLRVPIHGPIPMSAFSRDAFPSPNKPTAMDMRRAPSGRVQRIDASLASRQSTGRRSSSGLNSDLRIQPGASSKETASSTMATNYTSAFMRSRETSSPASRDTGHATLRSDAGAALSHRSTIRRSEVATPTSWAAAGDGGVWPAHRTSGRASLQSPRSKLHVDSSTDALSVSWGEAGPRGAQQAKTSRPPSTSSSTRTNASYKTALERPSSGASWTAQDGRELRSIVCKI